MADVGLDCHVIKLRWLDYKDLKDLMQNLEDYVTELLEWADTAFATLYPHDDTVLIKHWGACWAGTLLDKKVPMFAAGLQESSP